MYHSAFYLVFVGEHLKLACECMLLPILDTEKLRKQGTVDI